MVWLVLFFSRENYKYFFLFKKIHEISNRSQFSLNFLVISVIRIIL